MDRPGGGATAAAALLAVAVSALAVALVPWAPRHGSASHVVGKAGPETGLEGPIVVAGGDGEQRAPAIAAGEGGFVAAWVQCQACEPGGGTVAARVLDPSGQPAGPVQEVSAPGAAARAPSAAHNPDTGEFLILWSERHLDDPGGFTVRSRRLGPDGTPLEAPREVVRTRTAWPAAVVASRGAWHGYHVVWAGLGPAPDRPAAVIHSRRLDARGEPIAQTWRLSDPGFEALDPGALQAEQGGGAFAIWFAYAAGDAADRPRLRAAVLDHSGRPTGPVLDLSDVPVCAAALAAHPLQAERLLVTIPCGPRIEPAPVGALYVERLNRLGQRLGDRVPVGARVDARDVAVAAVGSAGYVLVAPHPAASAELGAWRLDDEGGPFGSPIPLGRGVAPAVAGDGAGGAIVLTARTHDDSDVVAYRVGAPAPTATVVPAPTTTPPPTADQTAGAGRVYLPRALQPDRAEPGRAGQQPEGYERQH